MSNIIYNLDEIENVVDHILSITDSGLVCFRGNLGAGKTTLIKALIQKLGATDTGSSPTFGLVNEYRDKQGKPLAYHLDCYRIENAEEALDFGIEEYLDASCWVFVEWPEKIESLLPSERTEIQLKHQGPARREAVITQLP
jgi:tRNA threonylcarbamoyladenosine biosynthesis protein TsaE